MASRVKVVVDGEDNASAKIKSVRGSLTELKSGIDLVSGAARKMYDAGLKAYNFSKAGAELQYAEKRFDRLAKSIGTTSNALMYDLRRATKGTLSDAELLQSAGDLMSLGLAKSHDQAVRLSSVVAALGMNMNQLVLTLSNKTTMRFDALGVSVDGFKERLKSLEATGMDVNDAFTEAFLRQAEDQVDRVGNKADEAIGQFQIFEASLKDVGATAQRAASDLLVMSGTLETTAMSLDVFAGNIEALARGENIFKILRDNQYEYAKIQLIATNASMQYTDAEERARNAAIRNSQARSILIGTTGDATSATDRYQIAIERANKGMEQAALNAERYHDALGQINDAIANVQMAQAAFNEEFGTNVASKLEAAGVRGEKYTDALAAIDRQNGTNLLSQHNANKALDEAIAQYRRTGDVEAFSQALEDQKPAWEALDDNLQKARSGLQEVRQEFYNLIQSINSADGMEITITANVVASGGSGGGDNAANVVGNQERDYGIDLNGNGVIGAKTGLSGFVVPPGYSEPNNPFFIATSSNEEVNVTPKNGRGSPGAGSQAGITIGTIILPNVTNPRSFIAELSKMTRRDNAAGLGFAGG